MIIFLEVNLHLYNYRLFYLNFTPRWDNLTIHVEYIQLDRGNTIRYRLTIQER